MPGTYGSILETIRHLVGSDGWYLFIMTDDRRSLIDEDRADLPALRAAMGTNAVAWSQFLEADLDPDAVLREVDEDDGYEKLAPIGICLLYTSDAADE